ncbi:MAG: hypothetical protein ACI8RN_002137 [Glaciecola sp.]|jgi:hypothetical protein|uniref:hypothetical protein n=1 Tax=Congregibacter sp. TaxID=2744308 RepID=UPI0039E6B6D8
MQQRLNNRWLSEELIEAVRLNPKENPASVSTTLESELRIHSELQFTKQGHRRMWQHLATALLLVGSAAFSYLAWSQAEQAPNLPQSYDLRIASQDTLSVERMNVRDLRVANRELQLRIAELQKAIKQAAP